MDIEIRKDWEIKMLEGQRYDDVFNEINLPTRAPGITKMHIVTAEPTPEGWLDYFYSALVEWGFIDSDAEYPEITAEIQEDLEGINIYTL